MSSITLEDLKRAIEQLGEDNPYPCSCEQLKKFDLTGCCWNHGVMYISKVQAKILRRILRGD